MTRYALGEGEEYELPPDIELVHTDPKTIQWRKKEFVRLGFSMGEADALALHRSAELRDIERWLANGCTHAVALEIAMPLELIVVPQPKHLPEFGAAPDVDEMTGFGAGTV